MYKIREYVIATCCMCMLDTVCSNIKWKRKCPFLFIMVPKENMVMHVVKTVQQTILAIRKKKKKHTHVLTLFYRKFRMSLQDVDT